MSRLRVTLVLATLAGLTGVIAVTQVAGAQQEGLAIEGQVKNATPNGSSVEAQVVVLHRHIGDRADDLEAVTDAEGRFRFEEIVYDPDIVYGISVTYQGALYGIDLDLSTGTPPPVSLTVYDAVNDENILSAPLVSVLIAQVDAEDQTLWALEITKIVNDSDFAYVPGPEPMKLLRFGLPPETEGLLVDTALLGADFLQVDRGFALTAGVPPGEHEIMFAYRFPYKDDKIAFTKSFPYGAGEFRMLAVHEAMDLSGPDLGAPEVVDVGGRLYDMVSADDLPRESRLTIDLVGLPQASFADKVKRNVDGIRIVYVAPAVLGVLMVGLVAFALWRRRSSGLSLAHAGDRATDLVKERQLLDMMARLERSLEEGKISDSEYARRRAALSARLASLSGVSG